MPQPAITHCNLGIEEFRFVPAVAGLKYTPVKFAPGARHAWRFSTRIRPKAFGWKSSRLAVQRVNAAVTEIKSAARHDATLAADGAVRLIEKLSPALEQVDSSSGSLGSAVNRALDELVPLIAAAPVDEALRRQWLERLFAAHADDGVPYIETLADYWGELCVTKEIAGYWADQLLGITRQALSPDKKLRGHFHGTTACLSALLRAERYPEIFDVLGSNEFWPYKRWAVKALVAQGKGAEAIRLAESSRGPWTSEIDVNRLCESILLTSGLVDEAYRRYGLFSHRGSTYLATFRAISKAYPSKVPAEILADLVAGSPDEEGKWFATAKEAKLYDVALALAQRSPCDPRTLARAARDFAVRQPAFARGAGLAALHWLVLGHGYEITSIDVQNAYSDTLKAAENLGTTSETKEKIRALVAAEPVGGFVRRVLGRELGLV